MSMVNICVLAKQTVDVSQVKIDDDTNEPILRGVERKISDFDKNAAEEAIKIKEKLGGQVIVYSLGSEDAKDKVREILAMGADEAVVISDDKFKNLDYRCLVKVLAKALKKKGLPDIIICGEASIDMYSGQVGPRLGEELGIPHIAYAIKLDATNDSVNVVREVGNSEVTYTCKYPVLITVTKEINEPRLPTLMQIIGASSKKIEIWSSADIDVVDDDYTPKVVMEEVKGVVIKRKNVMIEEEDPSAAVQKLMEHLKKDGILLGGDR